MMFFETETDTTTKIPVLPVNAINIDNLPIFCSDAIELLRAIPKPTQPRIVDREVLAIFRTTESFIDSEFYYSLGAVGKVVNLMVIAYYFRNAGMGNECTTCIQKADALLVSMRRLYEYITSPGGLDNICSALEQSLRFFESALSLPPPT